MNKLHSILPEERKNERSEQRLPEPGRPYKERSERAERATRATRVTREERPTRVPPRREASARPHRKRSAFNVQTWVVLGAFLILLIILVPTALTLRDTHRRLDEAKAIQTSLEQQRGELETSVADLKSQLDIVNTDAFIEKYAHEKLGMVRPNEILIRMEDGELAINSEGLAKVNLEETTAAPTSELPPTDPEASVAEEGETAPEEETNDNAASEIVPDEKNEE
ncbi:MAG: septum formation initiator family protein [Peptoniphilaceae bacterium]|nr:septum formation initiator family protein [Peptoniphilaceae bacterium]MDY6085637.1 septum formation initiator family protein [Peptoniphilaceae bacterium]